MCAGQAEAISRAARVANVGCYASSPSLCYVRLSMPPDRTDHPLTINAVSGYSGGGKQMIEAYEKGAAPAFELYALGLNTSTFPRSSLIRSSRRNPCSFRRSEIFVRECWCPSRCNSTPFPSAQGDRSSRRLFASLRGRAHVRLCDPPANGKLDALH